MAIVRKTAVFQVRCHPDDLAAFEASCLVLGVKPTDRMRRLMLEDALLVQKKAASKAKWEATIASRSGIGPDTDLVKKQLVVSVVASESPLVRKRRLQKEAKSLKTDKRANRFLGGA